jgi:hypothetical protein
MLRTPAASRLKAASIAVAASSTSVKEKTDLPPPTSGTGPSSDLLDEVAVGGIDGSRTVEMTHPQH